MIGARNILPSLLGSTCVMFFLKANLSMVVGSYFVQDGVGWVRLNIGTQKAILEEALHRILITYQAWK